MPPAVFTLSERSALEELENVMERRLTGGKLSLSGANGVAHALYEWAATRLECGVRNDAASRLGLELDDGEDGDSISTP
jgi:hypothetical protein